MVDSENESETFETIEDEARSLGWKPEDEWVGDEPKGGLLDAETYVERLKPVVPLLKKQTNQQKKEIDGLKHELKKLSSTAAQFNTFAQQAIERERRDAMRLREQLEQARADAISEGDGEAAVKAERQLNELDAQQVQPQGIAPEAQMIIERFMSDNPWYADDPYLRDWADGRAARLKNEGYPGAAVLDTVAREVKEAFPERFQNGAGPLVEGKGRRVAPVAGRKSFDDLPDEAQKQYHEFRELMPKFTKKEFLDQYEWDD